VMTVSQILKYMPGLGEGIKKGRIEIQPLKF